MLFKKDYSKLMPRRIKKLFDPYQHENAEYNRNQDNGMGLSFTPQYPLPPNANPGEWERYSPNFIKYLKECGLSPEFVAKYYVQDSSNHAEQYARFPYEDPRTGLMMLDFDGNDYCRYLNYKLKVFAKNYSAGHRCFIPQEVYAHYLRHQDTPLYIAIGEINALSALQRGIMTVGIQSYSAWEENSAYKRMHSLKRYDEILCSDLSNLIKINHQVILILTPEVLDRDKSGFIHASIKKFSMCLHSHPGCSLYTVTLFDPEKSSCPLELWDFLKRTEGIINFADYVEEHKIQVLSQNFWPFTIIRHDIRHDYCLSANEYIVLDLIYRLGMKNGKNPGWCSLSKHNMSIWLNFTKKTVDNIISSLKAKNVIRQHERDKALLQLTVDIETRLKAYSSPGR